MKNVSIKKPELLAPAGNSQKLAVAFAYGADAAYVAGKRFGLRAYADNFTDDELVAAIANAHARGKKIFVTVNIYADDDDLPQIPAYGRFLAEAGADGAIVSDMGVFALLREHAPALDLHVSTQANVTNAAAAKLWGALGAKRIVLARETPLSGIRRIRDALPDDVEIEAFVHGAMCIAYSGRCLLSSYFTERAGNKGGCVQCCRWEYGLTELSRGETLPVTEDARGTYIMSSKDLRMIDRLPELLDAGVTSLKIEGRVKSEYYVAGAVNAYRRALDAALRGEPFDAGLLAETEKISHRGYTTGFYFGEKGGAAGESKPSATHAFVALVTAAAADGYAEVEMRNRFAVGDELEVLSPGNAFNQKLTVAEIIDADGARLTVADKVQARLRLRTDLPLRAYDMLRKKV